MRPPIRSGLAEGHSPGRIYGPALDPTAGLLHALAHYGLHPTQIIWNGAIHRFPGKGKNKRSKAAWYVAYPDRRGACFGDFSQGLTQVNWQAKPKRPPTQADWDAWKRQDKERAKARAEKMALARNEVEAAWDAAKVVREHDLHPYLVTKGITEVSASFECSRKAPTG